MLHSFLLVSLLAACGAPPTLPGAGTEKDADGDGLSDADEAKAGSDPNKADSDGDGKNDGIEVHKLGTDPTKRDSDGDGVADGAEVMHGTDPNDATSFKADAVPVLRTKSDPEAPPPDGATPAPEPPVGQGNRIAGAGGAEPPESMQCRFDKEDLETCFVQIPGGTFLMGAQATDPNAPGYDPEALPNEGPVHEVTVEPYWIHRDEVIVTIFMQCLEARWCKPDDVDQGGFSTFKGEGVASKSSMPLNSIGWQAAGRLCDFLGGRLPTEAEWAFAARGPQSQRFPWGSEPGCGVPTTSGFKPDGTRLPTTMQRDTCDNEGPRNPRDLLGDSPFRLRGMAGNVWEWTSDVYTDRYITDGSPAPTGQDEAARRVQRGGGWTSRDPLELRAATRAAMKPDSRVNDVGLRCVWETKDAP